MTEGTPASSGRAMGSGAIPLGLGAMLGAGVFVGPAPASAAAGVWLLPAVLLAALTALCAALSTAEQSASFRGPGASYACVRAKLGVVPGRIGAVANLAGSAAAMAAVADTIAVHLPWASMPSAVAVILLVVLANTAGLRIRGTAGWLWLCASLAVLVVLIGACVAIAPPPNPTSQHAGTPLGATAAAGVLFFAFLGFERLTAPDAESDRHGRRRTTRAVIIAIVVTTIVLIATGAAVLRQLGEVRLALSTRPLLDALRAADAAVLVPLVGVGVAVALLPVLSAIVESVGSTGRALLDDGVLPRVLDRTGSAGTSYPLDLGVGVVAASLSTVLNGAQAMTFAACCMLVHYAFANAAARVLLVDGAQWRMRLACLGVGLSVILAMSMPVPALLATGCVCVLGAASAGLSSDRRSDVRR